MKPQLIGKKNSQATRKVDRFLKERRIDFQFQDVDTRTPSRRELDTIAQACGGHEELIDPASPSYRKRGLAYMEYDAREELLEHPDLLRVPIVRCDAGIRVQPDEDDLKELF